MTDLARPAPAGPEPPQHGASQGAAVSPAADGVDRDELLAALAWLCAHHGRRRSRSALVAGVPVDRPLKPTGALRVLREAGFEAGVLKRRLPALSPLLLPAVLMLDGGRAVVLTRLHDPEHGQPRRWEIVLPAENAQAEDGPGAEPLRQVVDEATLEAQSLGFVLVASPQPAVREPAHAGLGGTLNAPGSHWLWGTLRRFLPYYRSAIVAALLTNVLMLVSGVVTSVIYDKVIPHQAMVTLWSLAAAAGLALLFDTCARQMRSWLIDVAGRKADLIISSMLFRQTLGVRMEHRPASAGAYAHQLAQVEIVREFFASASLAALSDVPFVLLFVAMCFVIGGPLGWVLVLALPIILGLSWAVQGALRRAMAANHAQHADLQGVLVESVEGLEDLKAAGAQGRFLQRYEEAAAAAAESALRARLISGWAHNLSSGAQQAVTLVMLVWGVYLIKDGVVSSGALIGSVMFAGRAVAPLASVLMLATRYQGARVAMRSLDELMRLPLEREPSRGYVTLPARTETFGCHELRFAYPPQPGQAAPQVLKGLGLSIRAGERVAVLGRIGSGKSTLLRLLAGLYQPTDGRVEVDGLDLRQIDPADFRERVGFVSQDPRLFQGTLRENVLLGRAAADASQLSEVAALTGLDRLIAAHPMGWDLPVGEMGSLLSGGQRQLVALARCLVTQPQILLMDEPTSSMDAQSEALFLRQLKALAGRLTLVVVTHRPAVLELVERVLVVDQGRLVADGPKAAVMAALAGTRSGSAPQSGPVPGVAAAPASSTPEAAA